MSELPILDDRSFDELVDEARAALPRWTAEWSDHNPSDPGAMLIELLAWLGEMISYRLDRLPERSYRTFLRLLNGPDVALSELALDEAIRTTIRELRDRHRAITPDDFEYLALRRWPTLEGVADLGVLGVVRRVLCIAQQSPATLATSGIAQGHVTVVVAADSLAASRSDLASFAPTRRYALELDGKSGYVDAGADASLSQCGDLTLSAWIFPRNPALGRQGILSKQASGEFELLLEQNGVLTFYHADAADGGSSTVALPRGRWSHVAAVRSATNKTLSFFVDGRIAGPVLALAKDAAASDAPVVIGRRGSGEGSFDGFMRDVCIWKMARSAVELSADLRRRPAGNEAGLVACWRFDEKGEVAADATQPTRPGLRDGKLAAASWSDAVHPLPAAALLLDGLSQLFDEWRLLTTRVHVIDHRRAPIVVAASLYLRPDGVAAEVRAAALAALERFFDPLGGESGGGWPFGRSIFTSALTAVLDAVAGVDFVKDVRVSLLDGDDTRTLLGDDEQPIGVRLLAHELPAVALEKTALTLFQLTGSRWQPVT